MRRREFVTLLGSTTVVWPLPARAQQPALPVIGFLRDGSAEFSARYVAGFREGLNETGYVDGQNVTAEYHWLEGQYDRLSTLLAELVRRQVAVIATPGTTPSQAAKAATATIPIVFGVGEDPVRQGLVASLARPGGNVTGINFFVNEVMDKRLRLFQRFGRLLRRHNLRTNQLSGFLPRGRLRRAHIWWMPFAKVWPNSGSLKVRTSS
jgi:putative tryptophan/tyrosine transport system substrate-binding protein